MQSTLRGINYTCKFVYHFGSRSLFFVLLCCVDRYPVLTEYYHIYHASFNAHHPLSFFLSKLFPKMPKIQGCFDLNKIKKYF